MSSRVAVEDWQTIVPHGQTALRFARGHRAVGGAVTSW
jgi:hypothetical protein